MNQVKIGKFIAKIRKENNMTQSDLAKILCVTDRAVSKWENGRGLPNISLLEPLCHALGISINELLSGERIENSCLDKVTKDTFFDVLAERNKEIKKSKLLIVASVIFVCLSILLITLNFELLVNTFRGEGYTYFSESNTNKAARIARLIMDKKYEKASNYIAFEAQDRENSQELWCNSMYELSDNLKIEHFSVLKASANDWFISGDAILVVYDYQSAEHYIFQLAYSPQDGGIAFDLVCREVENSRKVEIATLIANALCTYYAG